MLSEKKEKSFEELLNEKNIIDKEFDKKMLKGDLIGLVSIILAVATIVFIASLLQ